MREDFVSTREIEATLISRAIIHKRPVFGTGISATTMTEAMQVILAAARLRRSLGVSALAVHGLVEATRDPEIGAAVGALDLVLPDGQPVRWALQLLHGVRLPNRVCGPDLMRGLCRPRTAKASASTFLAARLRPANTWLIR